MHGRGHQAVFQKHRAVRRLPPWVLRTKAGEFADTAPSDAPWLTLAQVTSKLLKESAKPSKPSEEGEFALPDTSTLEKLNELASAKLSEIVRRSTAREAGWRGYDELEVAAARELLSEETSAHSARER